MIRSYDKMDNQKRKSRTQDKAERTMTSTVFIFAVVVVLAWAPTKSLTASNSEDIQCLRQATVLHGSNEECDGKENTWSIDAIGTRFEITNSDYLNVTLFSTEKVRVHLESSPRAIYFYVRRAHKSSATLTRMTIRALEAHKKYYRYQDGALQEVFITCGNGSHSFPQDISTGHHVFIQEKKSTIYINSDGSIDPPTAPISRDGDIYTLTDDVSESVFIHKSGITLDGAGHKIESSATHGIYLANVSDTTILNTVVPSGGHGILLSESSSNTIARNTVSHCSYGIDVRGMSYDNDIHDNEISECGYGIWLQAGDRDKGNNIARQNTLADNWIAIYSAYDSWYNVINNNEVSRGFMGMMMWTTFRNTVTNNKFKDIDAEGIAMNWGLWGTFEGNCIENCGTGFGLYQSKWNTFTGNVVKDSSVAVSMSGDNDGYVNTDWNVFYHNDFVGDSIVVYPVFRNNVWDNSAGEGNYWSDYYGLDDGTGVGRFGESRVRGDGIGDTCVPHLAVDWYPSKRPWVINLNRSPIAVAGGPYLVGVDQSIVLNGSGSYDDDGDTLSYLWTQDSMLGNFDNPSSENPNYTGIQAGIMDLTLKVDDGKMDDTDTTLLVVYDPSGGFVTGGGWIDSPEGALPSTPLLTGKANFGFVSKYKKGATVPTGNTEFQFHAGGLNFHSSSYDWLVVTGSNYARFKGLGTIADVPGDFKFLLWAGDNESDTFRIKIWIEDGETENVVYDNGYDGSGYETGQPIDCGSIVVHEK
jgi:parallel beta-helix repeat protein